MVCARDVCVCGVCVFVHSCVRRLIFVFNVCWHACLRIVVVDVFQYVIMCVVM